MVAYGASPSGSHESCLQSVGVGRHEIHPPVLPHDPAHLPEEGSRIVEVLDEVGRHHGVESITAQGSRLDGPCDDIQVEVRTRIGGHRRPGLYALRVPASLREGGQQSARRASNFQHRTPPGDRCRCVAGTEAGLAQALQRYRTVFDMTCRFVCKVIVAVPCDYRFRKGLRILAPEPAFEAARERHAFRFPGLARAAGPAQRTRQLAGRLRSPFGIRPGRECPQYRINGP